MKRPIEKQKSWMLYGAYGAQGRLILEEALARGERPLLAGRSIAKLRPLAEHYGLSWRMIDLRNAEILAEGLSDIHLVLNAAGPYCETMHPLLQACLTKHVNYLDLNAEISVLQQVWQYQAQAETRKITAVVACGLEVAPIDCLLMELLQAHSLPESIEIAIDAQSSIKLKEWSEQIVVGSSVRRHHVLKRERSLAKRVRRFPFSRGAQAVISYSSAALEACYHWSHIPNITSYITQSSIVTSALKWFAVSSESTLIWIIGVNKAGERIELGLETLPEPKLTAVLAVQGVMNLLSRSIASGIYTPAQAFGAEFIMQIPHTIRFGALHSTHFKGR